MDWFGAWESVAYIEIEPVDPAVDSGRVAAWLIVAVIALMVGVMCYRHRNVRRRFWCASVGRDVEVNIRHGCVLSCSAFEDPTAVACARRCLDRSFRVQWPPAIPVLTRPGATAQLDL